MRNGGNAPMSLPLYNLPTFYEMFGNTVNVLNRLYFVQTKHCCIHSSILHVCVQRFLKEVFEALVLLL